MKLRASEVSILACIGVQVLVLVCSLIATNPWGLLSFFFVTNIGTAVWIYRQLLFSDKTPEEYAEADQSKTTQGRFTATIYEAGSGTTGAKNQPILSSREPPQAPTGASDLWEKWCRASGSETPDTLGSPSLERVDSLVKHRKVATDEEKYRREQEWFEAVYDELRRKVEREGRATPLMRKFAEMAGDFGYSLITASSGDDYDSNRHHGVSSHSPRKMVVLQMLLPGLERHGSVLRSRALVIFKP